jgi:hypothetical protein
MSDDPSAPSEGGASAPGVGQAGPIDEAWRLLLVDPTTTGEVLRGLALRPDVDPEALAKLAADERRLRQTPEIAAAIYANPRAPLSVANLAIVTCHRAGVVPEGIPGFAELALEIVADPAALDPAAVDSTFQDLLHGAPEEPVPQAQPEALPEKRPAPPPSKRRSPIIDFTRLKLYEKIRLATLGNAYCRQNLLRDSNRMVAMAVIRSPQITDGEIAKAAANRSLSEEVIRYIGNRKELVKQYPVKLALVGNAKCPLAIALRLLPTLNADDIKHLARSKNVPGALSAAAKRLAAPKAPQ